MECMGGWMTLVSAIIRRAVKDAKLSGPWKEDAVQFLESERCKYFKSLLDDWKQFKDAGTLVVPNIE